MSDFQAEQPATPFLDVMIVLARRKRLVFGLPVLVAITALLLSLALPDIYRANTRILPPQQAQSGAAGLIAQLGVTGAVIGGGIKNPNELYIGMLKSRVIANAIIEQLDLRKVYDADNMENARRQLAANTVFTNGKDGLINIEVEDIDPHRAARIATAYSAELLRLTRSLALTEASQRRLFLEKELQKSKDNLAESEAQLSRALDSRGVLSVDTQSRTIAENSGQLRAQITAKEVELGAMQAFVTPENQEFKKAQQQLRSMRDELDRLENGRAGNGAGSSVGNSADKAEKPGGLDNIKALRNARYHQMLVEMLSRQFEIARLEEARDASIIQVLETAVAPERKAKPMRAVITLFAFLLGFVLSIGAAFWRERMEEIRSTPVLAGRLQELKALLRLRK